MKNITILAIILLIILVPLSASAAENDTEGPVYKSATELDFPPFSVTDAGTADGFSVDLLKAVAKEMDLNITFKVDQWNIIKDELASGVLDVLPLVALTTEREEIFEFSTPYIILHGNIFIRTNDDSINTEDDLYGKEIIVMSGDALQEYALEMGFSDHLITTDTYSDAFRLLSSGKYDCVLAQSIVGQQLIDELGINNIRAAETLDGDGVTHITTQLKGFEMKFCFAVQKGNHELLAKLNEGLAIVMINGTFMQLYNEWFSFLVESKVTLVDRIKDSLIIVIPVSLILMLFAILYVERLIAKKTRQLKEAQDAVLSMEAGVRNKQKLESIGTLASGIAHEINNPVNGIMNYGQLILDSKNKAVDADVYANEIIEETKRIADVTKSLLQFSRQEKQGYSKASMKDILNRTLSLAEAVLRKDQVRLNMVIPDNLPDINCRHQQIQQVLMNLLTNARDALNERYPQYDENKVINISCRTIIKDNKKYVRTTIEDHGNGIPAYVQPNIFDPFFSTRPKDKRTGLGLSISYGIVTEHHGMLTFETEFTAFTRFHLDLPVF